MHRVCLAAALALATPALADQHEPMVTLPVTVTDSARVDGMFRTRDLTGTDIYSIGPESGVIWGVTELEGISDDWDDIGEVEDFVVNSKGTIVAVIAEIGGFLGLGDREVLIPVQELQVAPLENRLVYVTRLTEAQLEGLPPIVEDYWE